MARGIYEVKLKEHYFPAQSEEDALQMQNNGNCRAPLADDEVFVSLLVKEEHTMKLFTLAKSMYDTEKFEYKEVKAALSALAFQLGYYNSVDVAECIISWVERIAEDMTASELEEWLIG